MGDLKLVVELTPTNETYAQVILDTPTMDILNNYPDVHIGMLGGVIGSNESSVLLHIRENIQYVEDEEKETSSSSDQSVQEDSIDTSIVNPVIPEETEEEGSISSRFTNSNYFSPVTVFFIILAALFFLLTTILAIFVWIQCRPAGCCAFLRYDTHEPERNTNDTSKKDNVSDLTRNLYDEVLTPDSQIQMMPLADPSEGPSPSTRHHTPQHEIDGDYLSSSGEGFNSSEVIQLVDSLPNEDDA